MARLALVKAIALFNEGQTGKVELTIPGMLAKVLMQDMVGGRINFKAFTRNYAGFRFCRIAAKTPNVFC